MVAVAQLVELQIVVLAVAGSNPVGHPKFVEEISKSADPRTGPAQKTAESETRKMRFPVKVRHRKAEATIYGKTKSYPFYRVTGYVHGNRVMSHFATYSEARIKADNLVREIADGSKSAVLSANQSHDALEALERLESFRRETGKQISLIRAVSEYIEAASKLNGQTVGEAIERYVTTVATVKRKAIAEAVEEFIKADAPRTKAAEGQRAQLSTRYTYTRDIRLRRFAKTFANTAVCDLSKAHLEAFIVSLGDFSAKTRNHYRATVQQFLKWSVRRDYLPTTHRLNEADSLQLEHANTSDVLFYTPKEFRALLETADGPMRGVLAIGGLASLRIAELLRLDWSDVWRIAGHIEISSTKSKTRQRRLVEMCPALAAWLAPFRIFEKGKILDATKDGFQDQAVKL